MTNEVSIGSCPVISLDKLQVSQVKREQVKWPVASQTVAFNNISLTCYSQIKFQQSILSSITACLKNILEAKSLLCCDITDIITESI